MNNNPYEYPLEDDVIADDDLTREEYDDGDEQYSEEDDTQEPSEGEGEDETEEDDSEQHVSDSTPEGVKRRFATLTAKRRAAEARVTELEAENARLREASGMEDPSVYVTIAERYGILPEIAGTANTKALGELSNLEGRITFLRDTLDEMEDREQREITLSNETFMRSDLLKELRRCERRHYELKDKYGNVGKTLGERTIHLLRLGIAAEKAAKERNAKKPAAKKPAPKTPQRETPPRRQPPRRNDENPQDRLARIIRSFSAPK